jgi:hypothetical protein
MQGSRGSAESLADGSVSACEQPSHGRAGSGPESASKARHASAEAAQGGRPAAALQLQYTLRRIAAAIAAAMEAAIRQTQPRCGPALQQARIRCSSAADLLALLQPPPPPPQPQAQLAQPQWASGVGAGADLLAHDELELALAQPALVVAQPPVARYAEKVGFGHVQLGLEGLPPTKISSAIVT